MEKQESIDWYRSPVDKETMKRLMERSDWQGFRQVGLHLLLVTATGTLTFCAWKQGWWLLMLAVLYAHGAFFSFLSMGVAGHELSHRTVFKSRFWNDFFVWVVALISWGNHVHYRTSHTKHHQFTVYSNLDLEEVLPKQPRRGEWFWGSTLHVPGIFRVLTRTIRLACGRLDGEWEQRIFPESNPQLRRQLFTVSRAVLLTNVALAAVFIYYKLWIMFAIFTFAPFIATVLSFLCFFPQHAGLQPNVPDFRLCTRTMILHPFVSFLYWQMNYHIEHHMYATVPFYNLKKLRQAMEADLPQPSRGLRGTWKELMPILRRQKEDENYYFVPPLPSVKPATAELNAAR
jgi:fatty acid desaturase